MYDRRSVAPLQSTNLADLLERVLDKGVVIAGDIRVQLADVELLSIKIRLVVCSVEKAMAMGINWWLSDPYLRSLPAGQGPAPALPGAADLADRLARLEARLEDADASRTRLEDAHER